jgi:hypothetical protein
VTEHAGLASTMMSEAAACLTDKEAAYFDEELKLHESKYLNGGDVRAQSGFGRDELDWRRYREVVLAPVVADGTFLDVGCANGLLMESVVAWSAERGRKLEPFGLEISPRLAELARQRLPHWRDRIFVWQRARLATAVPVRLRADGARLRPSHASFRLRCPPPGMRRSSRWTLDRPVVWQLQARGCACRDARGPTPRLALRHRSYRRHPEPGTRFCRYESRHAYRQGRVARRR